MKVKKALFAALAGIGLMSCSPAGSFAASNDPLNLYSGVYYSDTINTPNSSLNHGEKRMYLWQNTTGKYVKVSLFLLSPSGLNYKLYYNGFTPPSYYTMAVDHGPGNTDGIKNIIVEPNGYVNWVVVGDQHNYSPYKKFATYLYVQPM